MIPFRRGKDSIFQRSIDVQLARRNLSCQARCLDLAATDRNCSFVILIVIRIFDNDALCCRTAGHINIYETFDTDAGSFIPIFRIDPCRILAVVEGNCISGCIPILDHQACFGTA